MADSTDSNKQQNLPDISINFRSSHTSNTRSLESSPASSYSEKVITRQTPKKGKNKNKASASPNSLRSDITPSPIPWETFYGDLSTPEKTPESQVECSFAFKYGDGKDNSQRRKRKVKKKSERNRSNYNVHKSKRNLHCSSDSDFEPLTDRLDRISRPDIHGHFTGNIDGVNVNIKSNKDDPSCTEYYIRTLDPLHNRFEVTSCGVQTDWSWLRDHKKVEGNITSEDMSDILERLKFGLYGGFGPDTQGILGKKDQIIPEIIKKTNNELTNSPIPVTVKINKNPLKVKKSERFVKSATKEKKVLEKIQRNAHSAKLNKTESNQEINKPETKPGPPEILRYHREKSYIKSKTRKKRCPKSQSDQPDCMQPSPTEGDSIPNTGLFTGQCQFCRKPIITVEQQDEAMQFDQMYCCPEYEHFINLHIASEITEEEQNENEKAELIDITPHAPYGAKQSRKAVRERVAERIRERELERQRAAVQANLFTFSRQMRTIQYSLASPKCMDEGWTVKPNTPPPENPSNFDELFHVEVNSTLLQKAEVLNEKFYDNGKRFLTIFPDGTGCCYYPNGNVAVFITSTEKGKYTYIVQSNKSYDELLGDYGILAVFEPNGHGLCYYKDKERIRLYVNAHGGIELDRRGKRRKRWQWYFVNGHTRQPPFQPLCFPLNKYISVRVLDQHNIALIFASQKRSVRFNVGANLTAHGIQGHGNFDADPSEEYLISKKKQLSTIITQIHSVLRLPKSSLPPNTTHRTSKRKNKNLSPRNPLPPLSSENPVIIS